MKRLRIPAPLLAVLAMASCSDNPVLPVLQPEPGTYRQEIACTADVRSGQVACGDAPAPGGGVRPLIVGGQNVLVRLRSSNAAYGSGVFSFDVSVQNLMAQPLGTVDGTTATGIRVFFTGAPSTTGGNGVVTVLADSNGVFTAPNQPYYKYGEVLQPRGTTSTQQWRLSVPATVSTFTFKVYVYAKLPQETGPLRWT
ncbi:MAG TPA: hypothetical protein VEY93_04415, partial [Longimicrobium sp.]|nr:hypothetical protein [Longimicrobium sp.]